MATRDDILQELGLTPVWRRRMPGPQPLPDGQDAAAAANAVAGAIASAASAGIGDEPSTARASGDDRTARIARLEWADFAADVDACTECGLARTRNRSVPGVGDRHAEWMFIGEAPGADEDARGEPFVGQAGRLLDSMLAALGVARGNRVYIANVLKCRPPNNRAPAPDEAEACRPYLDRQIALIAPRLIVALGKSAATTLLGVDCDDREPAWSRAPLSGRPSCRHLSSCISAAQFAGQGQGVGRSDPRPAHPPRIRPGRRSDGGRGH